MHAGHFAVTTVLHTRTVTTALPQGHPLQERNYTFAPHAMPFFRERRKDARKRDMVARGRHAARNNLVSGVEYLQARGIEGHIIRRVLLQLFPRS